MTIARVLIIAGSDSGGGAGIQADIKTVTMLGGHAMTAVTAITAQNTLGVQAVHPVRAEAVVAQMRSCLDDIGVDAVKIGMIGSAATADAVADVLEALLRPSGEGWLHERNRLKPDPTPTPPLKGRGSEVAAAGSGRERGYFLPIVFDPVMVATSGSVLADAETIAAFTRLMKIASVVTPNLPELAALGGVETVRALGPALLVKGGHGEGDTIEDRLIAADGTETVWRHPRIDTRHTHGTGCTLASGIAVGLGQGMTLAAATERAIAFVQAALVHAPGLGQGHGPMGHAMGTVPFERVREA